MRLALQLIVRRVIVNEVPEGGENLTMYIYIYIYINSYRLLREDHMEDGVQLKHHALFPVQSIPTMSRR